jgi:hypothetical protein
VDGQLNALLIRRTLDIYGIKRDDDWVETQLRKMASLGAIELIDAGTLLVARIAPAGRSHWMSGPCWRVSRCRRNCGGERGPRRKGQPSPP